MGGISVLILLGVFSGFLILFLIVLAIIVIYSILNYLFEGLFIFSTAKRLNMSKPGLAFIPYYNKVLLGKISGKEKLGKVLFGLELVTVLCNVASYFGDYINIYLLRCCGILLIVTLIVIFVINIYMAHKLMNRVTLNFLHF